MSFEELFVTLHDIHISKLTKSIYYRAVFFEIFMYLSEA